jgi:hypothetical protein
MTEKKNTRPRKFQNVPFPKATGGLVIAIILISSFVIADLLNLI